MKNNSLDGAPLFSRTERLVAWIVGMLLLGGLIALVVWNLVFVRIPPGHVGVRYSLLLGGTLVDEVLPEGFALKLPWDRVYLYEVRIQRAPFDLQALSIQGMKVSFSGVVLYRPVYKEVGWLQKNIGPMYYERLVLPVTIAAIREEIAKYDSHGLYSVDYQSLRDQVLKAVRSSAAGRVVDFVDLLATKVALPSNVVDAIEEKLTQEQLAASYTYRLDAERFEAERKRIQAIGIQTFYSIVSKSLNDTLLTWRGIEATVDLARSPNAKVVVVGGDRDQLPLILGSDITQQPATPTPLPQTPPEEQPRLPPVDQLPPLFPDVKRPSTWRYGAQKALETTVITGMEPAPKSPEKGRKPAGSRRRGETSGSDSMTPELDAPTGTTP